MAAATGASAAGRAPDSRQDGRLLFRHAGYDAFAKGRIGDAGANLYVTPAGEVRTIHHWDYDRDGHIDILANNDHNHLDNSDLFIYLNRGGREYMDLFPPLQDMGPLMHTVRWTDETRKSLIRLPTLGGGKTVLEDLNRDGWPDIAFCNFVHGWYARHFELLIYWGGPDGYDAERRTSLPTLTAHGLAAADLNNDGWPELILANRGFEYPVEGTPDQDGESYIYWGGPEGFSPARRTSLPTRKAWDVDAGDLNGNGHTDLVFINNLRSDYEVVIFRGTPEGPDPENPLRIKTHRPTSLLVHDLDGDGREDILVAHKNKELTEIFYNRGAGDFERSTLPIKYVADAAAQVLNADGHPDLVLAVEISYPEKGEFTATAIPGMPGQDTLQLGEGVSYSSASMVFWGGPGGFEKIEPTKLPTLSPRAVTIHDLDGDGYPDLLFANRQDGHSFDVSSYIYWGSEEGYAPYDRTELQGFGTMDIAVVDANLDGRMDVALVNGLSGKTSAGLDSLLFWGNPRGRFSASFVTRFPARTPFGSASADLNRDGYPDIVFCNQGNDAFIYWGSEQGYTPTNRMELPVRRSYTCEIADMDRDGYLDLVFGGRVEGEDVSAVIFRGGEDGLHPDRRRLITCSEGAGTGKVAIGDVTGNGHLDLLISEMNSLYILEGGATDFETEGCTILPALNPARAHPADFNGDGRLDILLINYHHRRRGDVNSYLYWNGPDGFDPANRTELPTLGGSSASVADLDGDGALDIVTSHYNMGNDRSAPSYIYWGGDDGTYGPGRRSELPAESSFSSFIADVNADGFKDLVVFNHTKDFNHAYGSWIYYGSATGFSEDNRSWFPSFGVHVSRGIDMGNIRDRRYRETYVSEPVAVPPGRGMLDLQWQADCPLDSSIQFQVRWAGGRGELEQAAWTGPAGADSFFDGSAAGARLPPAGRWFQYRAIFRSADGSNYPVLREVAGALAPQAEP